MATKKETIKEPQAVAFSNEKYQLEQMKAEAKKHRERLENVIAVMTLLISILLFDYMNKIGFWRFDNIFQYILTDVFQAAMLFSIVQSLVFRLRK